MALERVRRRLMFRMFSGKLHRLLKQTDGKGDADIARTDGSSTAVYGRYQMI